MKNLRLTVVAFALVTTPGARAVATTPCEVALGLGERSTGLGRRGFLGTLESHPPGAAAALADRAISKWNTKIFTVRTVDEAREYNWLAARIGDLQDQSALEHHESWSKLKGLDLVRSGLIHARSVIERGRRVVINPVMIPLFIIDPTFDLDTASAESIEHFRATIPYRPIYEFDDDDKINRLDPAAVAARFNPAQIATSQFWPQEPRHFRQDGYFFPKDRGVLPLAALDKTKSNTIKRLEKDLGRHRRQGYTFTINQDLFGVIRGAAEQFRKGQLAGTNRIDEDTIATYADLAREGKAVSFEAWEPDGAGGRRLIAGTFGTFADGSLELETVFYPPGKVDFARYLILLIRDRLKAVGIEYIDAGMVTGFTRDIKGTYLSATEFLDLFERRNRDARPDFTSPL